MSLNIKAANGFANLLSAGSYTTYSFGYWWSPNSSSTAGWVGGAMDPSWAAAVFGFDVKNVTGTYYIKPRWYDGFFGTTWPIAVAGQWYYLAGECDNSDANAYLWDDTAQAWTDINFTPTMSAAKGFMLGADNTYDNSGVDQWSSLGLAPGKFRHVRYWGGTTLSKADFIAERNSASAVKAGATQVWELAETDFSGGTASAAVGTVLTLGASHSTNYEYSSVNPTLAAAASIAPLAAKTLRQPGALITPSGFGRR
jgi:hypothetical protein